MTGVFRRGDQGTDTHRGSAPEHREKDGIYMPSGGFRRNEPCPYPALKFLVSRTWRKYISVLQVARPAILVMATLAN